MIRRHKELKGVFIDKDISIALKDKRIIVADDNIVNQMLMKKFFAKHQIEIHIAGNGLEVMDICRNNNISIIFMDCQMPEMDGFETAIKIREEFGDAIIIIAMTA